MHTAFGIGRWQAIEDQYFTPGIRPAPGTICPIRRPSSEDQIVLLARLVLALTIRRRFPSARKLVEIPRGTNAV